MVKMLNVRFGTMMMVNENRVDEYLAKGNRIMDQPEKKTEPKKTTRKKAVKK